MHRTSYKQFSIRKEYTPRKSIATTLYDNISQQQRDTISSTMVSADLRPFHEPSNNNTEDARLQHVIIFQVFLITLKRDKLARDNTIKLFLIALIVGFI